MLDIDRYREQSGNGWHYCFPNGHSPSVIADPRSPLRFEIYVPGELGREIAGHLGGQGNLIIGLTTEQVEAKLAQIAALPVFDPADPNPVVHMEPSAFDGAWVRTYRNGSQQYGPYQPLAA